MNPESYGIEGAVPVDCGEVEFVIGNGASDPDEN